MIREKIVTIDGRDITVKELKTSDVIQLTDQSAQGMALALGIISGDHKAITQMLKKTVQLPEDELESLIEGINNYSLLEQAFREMNSDFLACLPARFEGLIKVAKGLQLPLKSVAGS